MNALLTGKERRNQKNVSPVLECDCLCSKLQNWDQAFLRFFFLFSWKKNCKYNKYALKDFVLLLFSSDSNSKKKTNCKIPFFLFLIPEDLPGQHPSLTGDMFLPLLLN